MSNLIDDIKEILNEVLGREVTLTNESHLIDDDILDSLDSVVFLLNVEKKTGVGLPEEEVDEKDLFQVGKLISYIEENS